MNSDLLLAVGSRCMEAAPDCMHASDFRDSKDSAFRRSLSQWGNFGWLSVVPTLPACLEPRGDGFRASLGPVRLFALVRGDDGDLPETSTSVLRLTSPVLLGSLVGKVRRTAVLTPGTAHFELRPTDNLGTNGSILKTDTPRQAAGWRFYRSLGS